MRVLDVSFASTDRALAREGLRGSTGLWLLDQVKMKAWDRLLFVECGDGWLVEEAWRRMGKGRALGLSTSPRLVAAAVQLRAVPGLVEFSTWGGARFPVPDRSFDRVISCASWDWYREPAAVLHEMTRVLEPGGDAYLLDQAPVTAGVERLLAQAGLVRMQQSAPRDGRTPVIIHACLPQHPT